MVLAPATFRFVDAVDPDSVTVTMYPVGSWPVAGFVHFNVTVVSFVELAIRSVGAFGATGGSGVVVSSQATISRKRDSSDAIQVSLFFMSTPN